MARHPQTPHLEQFLRVVYVLVVQETNLIAFQDLAETGLNYPRIPLRGCPDCSERKN